MRPGAGWRVFNPQDFAMNAVAYHEAGHAVMALGVGLRGKSRLVLHSVSIDPSVVEFRAPGMRAEGVCALEEATPKVFASDQHIAQILAGPAAQTIFEQLHGLPFIREASEVEYASDFKTATECLASPLRRPSLDPTRAIITILNCVALHLARPYVWAKVEAVARQLYKRKTISGEFARVIASKAQTQTTAQVDAIADEYRAQLEGKAIPRLFAHLMKSPD
jgi:hypothetical protein